jgi:tetratricopeptide (TPR) repeat protein
MYQKAEHILQKAIELSPKWHLPYLHLGWAYEKQHKFGQALDSYQQAVRLNPDDFHSRVHLGYLYQHLGDQEAGLKELNLAYQLNSQDITLIYNLANGLHKLDRSIEGIRLLDQALEILENRDQSLAHLYNLRGNIYLDLGLLDQSFADLQRAVSLDPTKPSFYNDLGDLYFEKGQYEEAVSSYKHAVNSETEKGSALKGIGRSYLQLENWHAAITALEEAQLVGELDFFGLGLAYFELGDDKRGIENLKKEISNAGPATIEASYYLGLAYAATGDSPLSIKTFQQFLELSASITDKPEWEQWRIEAKRQIEAQQGLS